MRSKMVVGMRFGFVFVLGYNIEKGILALIEEDPNEMKDIRHPNHLMRSTDHSCSAPPEH